MLLGGLAASLILWPTHNTASGTYRGDSLAGRPILVQLLYIIYSCIILYIIHSTIQYTSRYLGTKFSTRVQYIHMNIYNFSPRILRFTGPTTHRWKQQNIPEHTSERDFEFRAWFVHSWLIPPTFARGASALARSRAARAVHVIFQNRKFQINSSISPL
jgi:hypothetical protein